MWGLAILGHTLDFAIKYRRNPAAGMKSQYQFCVPYLQVHVLGLRSALLYFFSTHTGNLFFIQVVFLYRDKGKGCRCFHPMLFLRDLGKDLLKALPIQHLFISN